MTSQYEQIEAIICENRISKDDVIRSLKTAFGKKATQKSQDNDKVTQREKKNERPRISNSSNDSSLDIIPGNETREKDLGIIDNDTGDVVDVGDYDNDGDEDENLLVESERVDLLCPLSRDRIITPVRGKKCEHIQCIDLQYFIDSNLKDNGKKWYMSCPICFRQLLPEDLRLDEYMMEIIKSSMRTRKSSVATNDYHLDDVEYYENATVEYSTGEYYFDNDDSDHSDSSERNIIPSHGIVDRNGITDKEYQYKGSYNDKFDAMSCECSDDIDDQDDSTDYLSNYHIDNISGHRKTGKRSNNVLCEDYRDYPIVEDEGKEEQARELSIRHSQISVPRRKRRKLVPKEVIELSE